MNYFKHYDKLIGRSQNRVLTGYYETHHILPKCLGGSDNLNNLVQLTAREHFVAHQLLVKMYPGNSKLVFAIRLMTAASKGQLRNNREYEWVKRLAAKHQSERMKNPKTEEHKRKISDSNFKTKRKHWTQEQFDVVQNYPQYWWKKHIQNHIGLTQYGKQIGLSGSFMIKLNKKYGLPAISWNHIRKENWTKYEEKAKKFWIQYNENQIIQK